MDTQSSREKARYQRKGYGLLGAILITVLGIVMYPQYLLYYIFKQLQNLSRNTIYQLAEHIQIIILIGTHITCFSLFNLIMYGIYMIKSPFFEKYRTRQNPWPWEENKAAWEIRSKIVLKNCFINMVLGALMCIMDTYLSPVFRIDLESFPSVFEMAWQIVFSMILEDTCFYWCHRTLHRPKLYSLIHKKHHEFYTTVSYSAIYAHPLEYVFGDVIPVFIGSKLLGSQMHLATLQVWLMMRIGETVDGHSGYEFSWSPFRLLPFSSSAEYHNYHHSHNIGNYESFFSVWDSIMGTNKSYNKFIEDKYKNKLQ